MFRPLMWRSSGWGPLCNKITSTKPKFICWSSIHFVHLNNARKVEHTKFHNFYINNCPTRCNTKQSIYYSASSPYIFQVSATPIIRNTQNCNYNLRYWSYFFMQLPPSNMTKLVCRIINRLLCVASRWISINIDQRCTAP